MKNTSEKIMQHKKQNKLAAGIAGLLSLSFSLTAIYFAGGGVQTDTIAAQSNSRTTPVVRHELVPHVVLPESIEYKKAAKSGNAADTGFIQSGGGMVSPFVATYTPFPSYQVPATTSFQPVGHSVYPVVEPQVEEKDTVKNKRIPQRLPSQKQYEEMKQASELQEPAALAESPRKLLRYFEEEPADSSIHFASNNEEVVSAIPYSDLDDSIEQSGFFCQKPAKAPAAWSFSSPLFKAGSIPMGNNPQFNGSINQSGRCGTMQVGFSPIGMPPQGFQGYPMNAGFNGTDSNGVSVQQLQNGMLLVSTPPDHSNCGIIRCRCGNQPQMTILPAGSFGQAPMMNPAMAPMMAPAGMIPTGNNGAMAMHPMMQQQYMQQLAMQQYMQQQQLSQPAVQMMPVASMTPYGMAIVGYQAVPMNFGQNQGLAALNQNTPEETGENTDGAEGANNGLRLPQQLPANGLGSGMIANPYGIYAQQFPTADGKTAPDGSTNTSPPAAGAVGQNNVNPFGYYPMMVFQQPQFGAQGGLFARQHNPSVYYVAPFGYGNAGMMNCSAGGFGGGMPYGDFDMNASVTRADLLTMMTIIQQMQQNQNQRRFRILQRFADRREMKRQQRGGGASPDLMMQLMQAWSTPYMAPDTALRMPAANMYPYGYFGAQPGGVQTANYGGFYNLSTGSTAYPGLY
ncbi:MAG: hypothetical protein FWE67_04690 [Planctomycetaceae bacterium]|nr:hypothetical protein [Planctomycetaceae bacterium]